MKIFGLKPMSTWDRMNNIVKIMGDLTKCGKSESVNIPVSELQNAGKSVGTSVKNELQGKICDLKA